MAFDVRTREGMIARIIVVSLTSVAASVAATIVMFYFVFGFDLDRTFTGRTAVLISAILSISVPTIVSPIVTWRACLNIRETQLARDSFERLSRIDQLTGLPNRRGFDELAARRWAQGGGPPVSALMLDIDSFKTFNDDFGHGFGDAALLHVANVLRSSTIGTQAVLGRQGGDEFAVALPGVDASAAVRLAEQIRAACARQPVRLNGHSAQLQLSVGVASSAGGQAPLSQLMSHADAALLGAKRAGRNRVVCAQLSDAAA